jgi:hypothetical protein
MDEGVSLKIIEICLSVFILLASAGGTALAEDGINGSESGAGSEISSVVESLSLEGIWTFSLGASEEMAAVLYQSEGLIWGATKSEKPEPMNGILSGSISGDGVEIKALYVYGDVLTFTGMEGTFAGETIRGSYFQINSLGDLARGSFAGMRTGKDPREYAPLSAAQSATEATTEISQISGAEVGTEAEVVEEETGGFTDVHQLSAGINPRILGYAAPVTGKSRIV